MDSKGKPCRNCGGSEWYAKDVAAESGAGRSLLPLGLFSDPEFHIRVCGNCGLVDWFVPPTFLKEVKDQFERET